MKYLFLLSCSLCIAAPAWAASEDGALSDDAGSGPVITVLGTGSQLPLDQSGQSISVIGPDEIESIQSPDVVNVLERLPGVTLARNGGLGGITSLFVRGANSQQVLVLIDGIRVADTAAPSGGYDFGNLMTGAIGKVELLRGSNSVVWGSDAIGGVVAFTTREVNGIEGGVQYGSRNTIDGDVSGGYADDRSAVTVSAGYTETDGFSSAAIGTEDDGFRQYRASGRARLALTDTLSVTAAGRYADNRLDIDGTSDNPPYALIDTPQYSTTEEISGRAGLAYRTEALDLEAGYAIYDIDRANFDPRYGTEPSFASQGRQDRAEIKGALRPGGALRLDFGADREWSRYETTYDEQRKASLTGAHALIGWYADGFTIAAGARLDDHSRFGSEWTFGANGSVDLFDGWRVRASYGEGFKVPTLYQLYSDSGNAALQPERSKSYDIGIEKGSRADVLHLALTAFRRDTTDLIDYASCFSVESPLCAEEGRYGFYHNVGKARAQGVELELGARITENFHAQAAYTYLETENRTPGDPNAGNWLARRPRHAVTVAVDWATPWAGLKLGGDVRMVGETFDNAANTTRLDGYALGTVRASLPVSERIELFGRVENLTDEEYQTAAGYGTAGRSAYIGARARF